MRRPYRAAGKRVPWTRRAEADTARKRDPEAAPTPGNLRTVSAAPQGDKNAAVAATKKPPRPDTASLARPQEPRRP